MHKKDIVHLYSATEDLKLPFRIRKANNGVCELPNAVIDIPILNEAAEQVIFMKVRRHSRCHRTTVQISG